MSRLIYCTAATILIANGIYCVVGFFMCVNNTFPGRAVVCTVEKCQNDIIHLEWQNEYRLYFAEIEYNCTNLFSTDGSVEHNKIQCRFYRDQILLSDPPIPVTNYIRWWGAWILSLMLECIAYAYIDCSEEDSSQKKRRNQTV